MGRHKHYTVEHLDKAGVIRGFKKIIEWKRRSDDILDEILQFRGTVRHAKLVKESEELNRKEIALRKTLGIYLPEVCHKEHGNKNCEKCDGWMILKSGKREFCLVKKQLF